MGRRPAILLGDEEVTAVKAWLAQSWRDHFYGSFSSTSSPLSADASVLALHRGGAHAAETRGCSSELEWITSVYYPHNAIWHSGDGLPGLGLRGKGLDKLEWPAARRQGTREGRKRKIALFLRNVCVLFFHYHSDGCVGRLYGPCSNKHNSLCNPEENGVQRGFSREAFLVGGPAVAGLDPLLFLSADQEDAGGAGSNAIIGSGPWRFGKGWRLAERERARICWVLAGWGAETAGAGFAGCLGRRSLGATLSSCWAGALGQEVSHSLWRLLCLCEALSESFHRRSKEAAGGNWSIKEGDPVRILNLHQREPQVALEHYQAGHRPSYGLGGGLGGLAKPGLLHFSAAWESQDQAQTRLRQRGAWPDRPGEPP